MKFTITTPEEKIEIEGTIEEVLKVLQQIESESSRVEISYDEYIR